MCCFTFDSIARICSPSFVHCPLYSSTKSLSRVCNSLRYVSSRSFRADSLSRASCVKRPSIPSLHSEKRACNESLRLVSTSKKLSSTDCSFSDAFAYALAFSSRSSSFSCFIRCSTVSILCCNCASNANCFRSRSCAYASNSSRTFCSVRSRASCN